MSEHIEFACRNFHRPTLRTVISALLAIIVSSSAALAVTTVWTRTVNGSANGLDGGSAVTLAPSGSPYVVGFKTVTGQGSNIWIRKYSAAGATGWTRTIDGPASGQDEAAGAAVDSLGNLYVVGAITVASENTDIWIRKYNSSGGKIWTRTVDGPAHDLDGANAAAVDSNDNLFVVGYIQKPGEFRNLWVRKYNSSGTKLWTRTYNGNSNEEANGAAVDSDGNLYVVGYVTAGGQDTLIFVRKYSPDGAKLWTRSVDGPAANGSDRANAAATDSNGNVYVVGFIETSAESANIWIRKYSPAGTKMWTRTFNGPADLWDDANGVAVGGNGAVYVVGTKVPSLGSAGAWIRKYSPTGTKRWTTTYDGPDNYAWGHGIAVSATDRVYATGRVQDAEQQEDVWVRKYQQ